MLSNDELLVLVRNTDKRESWRLEALNKLIANLAIDHLYRVVIDTDRYESWRRRALNAICEISTLRGVGMSESSLTISVGGSSLAVNTVAVTIGIPAVADRGGSVRSELHS